MELRKLLQHYWFELNHDWISSGIFTACTTKFLSENFAENKSKFLKLLVPVGFGGDSWVNESACYVHLKLLRIDIAS